MNEFRFVRFFIISLFCLLATRLVYVQGILKTTLQQKAERQLAKPIQSDKLRLSILDRNHFPLTETIQVYSCFIDPSKVVRARRTAHSLASILDLNEDEIYAQLQRARGSFMWVKRNIPVWQVAELRSEQLEGIGFKLEYRRHYPMGTMASHLLGLVGIDGVGLSGIEQQCNTSLARQLKKTRRRSSASLPKGQIQLTIDSWIQQIAEKELDWGAKKTRAKKGMVLVQDPWTGEILALAAWPPLNLNPDNPPSSSELHVPPVSFNFEPGSTFKVVVAAAALEEALVSPNETFSGEEGAWEIADITIHDHEPQGKMRFSDIFVHSSNIGTAKIADRVGSERLYQYARLFGFGVYPGCGIPGEAKGMLRNPRQWSGISKNVISFGQEVSVTALQMIGAYSAIANGGNLMEPRIVKGVVDEDNKTRWQSQPHRVRRVVSEKTAAELRSLLTEVVDRGSGRRAKIRWQDSYPVAGKTGTAQKFDSKKRQYDDDLTLISFCGFFPADKPKLTMLVILDEPEGRRWGGVDAAPVFRRIAEQMTSHILL